MRDEILQVSTRQGRADGVLVVELNGPLLVANVFDFQQAVRTTDARRLWWT
jgi:hypothetical protein